MSWAGRLVDLASPTSWERLVGAFVRDGDSKGDGAAATAATSSSRRSRRSLFACCLPVPPGRVGRLVSQSVYQVLAGERRVVSKKLASCDRYTV